MGHCPRKKPQYASLPKIEACFVLPLPLTLPSSLYTSYIYMEFEPWPKQYGIKKKEVLLRTSNGMH
jgi:hypothetical protein